MTVADIRSLVFCLLEQRFLIAGISSVDGLDNSFDMVESGVLDSLGFVELLTALEQRLGVTLDISALSTAEVSNFTTFCTFVHTAARGRTT
jgi:acyl carrier protein